MLGAALLLIGRDAPGGSAVVVLGADLVGVSAAAPLASLVIKAIRGSIA